MWEIGVSARPKGEAVDWLATECVKLRKHHVAFPFPFAALKKWVPSYAADLYTKVCSCLWLSLLRIYSASLQAESADNSIMTMAVWQLAFDKYALGAAMVQNGGKPLWAYTSAKAHFEVCMKVAVSPSHCVAHASWWFVIVGRP